MNALNQIPCPVLVTDAAGGVLDANTNMLVLLGGTPAQWLQQPMEAMFPPASRIFLQTHVWPMLLREQRVQELYLRLIDGQGQHIPVMLNCQLGQFGDQTCYYWVFFVARQRSQFEAELLRARGDAQRLAVDLAQAHAEIKGMNTRLLQRTQTVEAENRALTELSQTDPLTGMGNRRALANAAQGWQCQAPAYAWASLLMIDVDHFKAVNDRHGHDEGDRVLVELAEQLLSSVRGSDVAVRYGGEEFALWLPQANLAGAERTAERVHEHVRAVRVAGRPITVSIGAATLRNSVGPELLQQLIQRADKAVYQAKSSGRNRTEYFDSGGRQTDPAPSQQDCVVPQPKTDP